MTKNTKFLGTLFGAAALFTFSTQAKPAAEAATIGQTAPAFTLKNTSGEDVSLADYEGKTVVLEWINFDCPFVKKFYASGYMPKWQEAYTTKDVVWLSIHSAAKEQSTYMEGPALQTRATKEGSKATEILLDPSGTVGRSYGAITTPQVYVINKEGNLVYFGAVDDAPNVDAETIEDAENYLAAALNATLADEEVKTAKTKPYGCGVKY